MANDEATISWRIAEALKTSKVRVTKNTTAQISEWKKKGNSDNSSDIIAIK